MWPSLPLPSPYNLLAGGYPFDNVVPGLAGAVPYPIMPFNYCLLVNSLDMAYSSTGQSQEDVRKILLNRSIFDLVNFHKCLQLTDQPLLGWYLSLNVGDRKIIQDEGGFRLFLQRHPALELTTRHVYVKYSRGHTSQAMMSSYLNNGHVFTKEGLEENHGAGCLSGAGPCRDLCVDRRELECLPNTVRESLNLLDHHEDFQGQSFQAGSSHPALFEGSPGQASASLDAELEYPIDSWTPLRALHSLPVCTEAGSPLPSPSAGAQGDPSEFHSFDCSQSFLPGLDHSASCAGRDGSKECSGARACSQGTSPPVEDREEGSIFHSVLEEYEGIPVAKPSGRHRDHSVGAGGEGQRNHSAPGNAGVGERATSPPAPAVTCSVAVGTGPRTEVAATAEKGVSTTVHIADLDYLAMEFVKLKSAQKELQELKKQQKSSQETGAVTAPCEGCGGRAQRAELRLLALHYIMCQQHAWRDCITSSDHVAMATTHTEPQGPPAKLVSVCQKLQSDYQEMRSKILAGGSLENLQPLSVASATLASSCPYSPPLMLDDALQDVAASAGPPESWTMETIGGNQRPPSPKGQDPKEAEGDGAPVVQSKVSSSEDAASLTPEHSGTTSGPAADHAPTAATVEEEEAAGAFQEEEDRREEDRSEAWYDAEEELAPCGAPPSKAEDAPSGIHDRTKEGCPEEMEEQETTLYVSGLPEDVTKTDVMQGFEKDNVPEVIICPFRNNLKVAMAPLNGPLPPEVALGKMNVRGSTVHVEHLEPEGHKTDNLKATVKPSPAVEGPCVPQYNCTMGSFDKLLDQLTARHPEVGRRAIVEALLEVKAQRGGVLSGLPLSDIADMTSRQLASSVSGAAVAPMGE